MSDVVMGSDQEWAEALRFLHRVEHLRWRKGLWVLPEGEMVAECWMPLTAPQWALESAKAGASGSHWCPQINGALAERDN